MTTAIPTVNNTIKRENGGSSYKRANRKLRPWVVAAPAKQIGKKYKRLTISTYASQAEARRALEAYLMHPTDRIRVTLSELYAEWSEITYRNVSKQTADCYRAAWNALSPLGGYVMRNIRTPIYNKLLMTTPISRIAVSAR